MSDVIEQLKGLKAQIEQIVEQATVAPDDRLLSLEDGANFLCVSLTVLRQLIDAGEIPIVDMGPKLKRVCLADLRKYRDSKRKVQAA